jgi:hypothetical protein
MVKINDIVTETASAGAGSAGGIATVTGSVGGMQKRNMYNADGTMKNALDQDNIFANSAPKKKPAKKKR